jgi:predicted ester cyclase
LYPSEILKKRVQVLLKMETSAIRTYNNPAKHVYLTTTFKLPQRQHITPPMGLFGRKNKKKNKVSFGKDVEGGETSPHNHKTTEDDKINETPSYNINNSSTSVTSSSSSQADEETQQQQQEILLPFREPKPLNRSFSMNSDLDESHRQTSKNEEADYMDRSADFGDIDHMSAEESFDYMTPLSTPLANTKLEQKSNKIKNLKPSLGTTVMPPIPDLDKSKSARIGGRDVTPDGTNMSALVIGSNDNNNSNSNGSKKSHGKTNHTAANPLPNNKNNHDTNRSYQNSDQQVQQRNPQQNQHQYHPQQQQKQQPQQQQPQQQLLLQHEIQSEQTRDLVKAFIGEIWNRGEIESIERVCSPRLRFNGHTGLERVGHDGFSQMVTTVRSSLEGYHCEIHSMVVEGRKCFCRLKFTGKHVGKLMGYPPTHKLVAWMGASEFTICPRKKQILKVWELGDIKTLEAQLMR